MSDAKHSDDVKEEGLDKDEKPKVPIDAHYDPAFVSRTLRQVDLRMLPLLGLLYALALIDRTNLGIARVAGMDKDLLTHVGERYSIASMAYFPPYILLEVPGNLVLQWIGARNWLTICVVGWGAAQIGMAFVKNWGMLCLCRAILGVFEAGFFPALAFIITTWYKRQEVQKRLAAFYLIAITFGGFSAIMAYGFAKIAPRGGLNGWQWIFLIEGLITVALGILTWLFVTDFPHKNKFLTEEQTKMILDRVEADRGDSVPDPITASKIFKHMADPLLWSFALMFLAATMPAYAIGFFITIILRQMGYTYEQSFLLTAPPYVAAAVSTFFFAWLADKTKKRALWLAVQVVMVIVGLAILGWAGPNGARYFGIFLINMGASGCVPGVLAYNANNIIGYSKRSVSTAMIIAFGGIGGIFATLVYRQKDQANRYKPGLYATFACQGLFLILLAINTYVFKKRNAAAAAGKRVNEGTPGFLYTI